MTPILGGPQLPWTQAASWAASRGAPAYWCELAELCWAIRGWVRPEVQWAQACKETGFGRFGGVLDRSFHNPCGMKSVAGGDDSDPSAHHRFPDWDLGFIAHRDHLALYAGAPGYPRKQTPDPRHFAWLLGDAGSVEDLGGRWAPAADYGLSVVRSFLAPLEAFHG